MLLTEYTCPACGGTCRTQPGKGTVCPYCMFVLAQPDPKAAAVLGLQCRSKRRIWYGFIIGLLVLQTLLACMIGGDHNNREFAHTFFAQAILWIWLLNVVFAPALLVHLRNDEWWVTGKPVPRLLLHIILKCLMAFTIVIGVLIYQLIERFIG